MITVLHGDDITASRTEFQRLKISYKNIEILSLNGKALTTESLTQSLESESLFDESKVVVIENFLTSLGKKSKLSVSAVNILKNTGENTDILLWEDKEIAKSYLDELGKHVIVRLFKIPTVIFQFLDSLKPNNAKFSLPLFNQSTASNVPEVIFVLLTRRIRHLIQFKNSIIPDSISPWQKDRLTNQAKLFTMEQLLFMYKKLAELEYNFKSGLSPFTFQQLLEQFVLDI